MRRPAALAGAVSPYCARRTGSGVALLALTLAACSGRPEDARRLVATVNGLAGSGLALQVNGGSEVSVAANGRVTLGLLVSGAHYSVAVKTQPSNPTRPAPSRMRPGRSGRPTWRTSRWIAS